MRITFQPQNIKEPTTRPEHMGERQAVTGHQKDYRVSLFAQNENLPIGGEMDRGKSLIELQQEAQNTNAAVTQDYMTLMSHTLSEEDYAKAREEGFDFSTADVEEVVTIVDKIKAELVKAGVNIQGYTDDLSLEQLTQALGSETLAQAVQDSFHSGDVPLSTQSVADIQVAWDMASQLQSLTEGDMVYLTEHQLKPVIWNLYLAQNSGAGQNPGNTPKFFSQEIRGYFGENVRNNGDQAAVSQNQELMGRIDKRLEQLGLEVNEENRQQGAWLVEKGLALTEENIGLLKEYGKLQLPVSQEQFAQSVAVAAAEGKKPIHANLLEQENIYQKANRVLDYYNKEGNWTELAGDLTGRRQLEEVRLRMTAEVNVKLIRSGFAIDTAPMEELVEALKQAEQQVAKSLFPQAERPVEQYHLYHQTNQAVKEIPTLPVQVLKHFLEPDSVLSMGALHREGSVLQHSLEKASASYETLMTTPRRDMGDSIKKAFAGVDRILEDLQLEITEANRKAVRTLGYNQMPINEENISRILQAQERVESVLRKMTPASTLQMIRDGINPLTTGMEELSAYLDSQPEDYHREAENYARFLLGLEKNHDITPEEREGYIGIYRLVRQIEKSDGAVVGALVNTGAELQFANLLSAVRSSRFKGMDVKADDATGTLEQLVQKGDSISEQIARAFLGEVKDMLTGVSETPEVTKEYQAEQLEQLRRAAQAPQEAVELLAKGHMPVNAYNLVASQALLQDASNPFKVLRDKAEQLKADSRSLINDLAEVSSAVEAGGPVMAQEQFVENYTEMIDELQEQVEAYTFQENAEEPMTLTALDIRELQLYHKQLSILGNVARHGQGSGKEEYMLPMYIGEQLTRVHLTVESGSGERGTVNIHWNGENGEELRMHLRLSGDVLSWSLEGKNAQGIMENDKMADILSEMAGERWQVQQDRQLLRSELSSKNTGSAWLKDRLSQRAEEPKLPAMEEAADNKELYRVARMALQAIERGRNENQL